MQAVLAAAIAAGLLPAGSLAQTEEHRPWPVLLLTAFGAWLAALPLLGLMGMMLGDVLREPAGCYVLGALVIAGAVAVFRAPGLPLFVEQLALPGLIAGVVVFGIGLFQDLPMEGGAAVLALLAAGLTLAVDRAWLRALFGASAALAVLVSVAPAGIFERADESLPQFWLLWHGLFALWLAAKLALEPALASRARYGGAAALAAFADGWLSCVLAGLAWWSGISFLAAASLGPEAGRLAGEWSPSFALLGEARHGLQAVSGLLAALAAAWLAWCWPGLRRPWCLGVAGIAVVLAALMPTLGAVLLALALCVGARRWILAGAAGLAAVWILGSFYYQLGLSLRDKAFLLMACGALLGLLAVWGWPRRGGAEAWARLSLPAPLPLAGVVLALGLTLAVANGAIWQKEAIIAGGQPVFVELMPVDPRSLMQGDYMRLRFRLPRPSGERWPALAGLERPYAIGRRDERGILALERIGLANTPLQAGELRVELSPKDGGWTLVTDGWFFKEGEGERWEKARYGEFRVTAEGRALLVGMADGELKPIRP
ncbi:MAG: GDYXXLXY domain-containing protein [Gammaproteobacteria bacterium]|nr:GDYXXLXY domain-containing protein [Gammaproteobacteria bacterium]